MFDVKDVYVDKRTNIKKTIYDEHSYIVKIINIQNIRKLSTLAYNLEATCLGMMKRQDENFYESKFMIDICRNP